MSTATVSAAGGMALSALTILAAAYMLVSLVRQGLGKMRVRLLMGVVISDMAIGLSTLPPQALSIAGRPILTGQRGCNAQAFLHTAALLSQPLASLFLAFATYILIKHPLHPLTVFIEKYSCFSCVAIWIVCFLTSGLWWHYIGFEQRDNMCSYASNSSTGLDRALIQFIPRTVVFIALIVIYSRLFSFLRRPDQIDLSSHDDNCDIATKVARRYRAAKCAVRRCMRSEHFNDPTPPITQPPWEAVSFVDHNHLPHTDKAQPDSISKASVMSTSTFSHNSSQTHSVRLPTVPQLAFNPTPRPRNRVPPPAPSRRRSRRSNESLTMTEFFAADPAPHTCPRAVAAQPHPLSTSAAQYFNRQASLLMLWFPLAYMATFLFSIICLAIHMGGVKSEVFSVMSLWMILAVGVIDAGVYGVVEVVVRRRVRRRLPLHF